MSSFGNQFQDKANRLLNKLTHTHHHNSRTKIEAPKMSTHELSKLREELEYSEGETCKKMKGLNDTLKKLEGSLVQQGQMRAQKDESFSSTIAKLQKNMKNALNSVQKGFSDREKRLEEKIDNLIKNEKKQLQNRLKDNDGLIQQMEALESKITAIVDEVVALRRARTELQDRINRQFQQQLRQLKRIFEADIHAREERETKVVQALKGVYKAGMEKIYTEEKEREESQKMLMAVIEQLVQHIIEV